MELYLVEERLGIFHTTTRSTHTHTHRERERERGNESQKQFGAHRGPMTNRLTTAPHLPVWSGRDKMMLEGWSRSWENMAKGRGQDLEVLLRPVAIWWSQF
jgi:hypothetical protein